MKPGFSLWLDVLRALAALMVLVGHAAHLRFTDGVIYGFRTWNVASDFVIVFFVLSGLVIAYASERDGTLGAFAFNRLTRLWSVLLPAILLTIVLDRVGYGLDPLAYPTDYYGANPAGEMLLRGLTFSVEWSGVFDRIRLGSNGPIWSLSYEAAFYILFGVAVFLRGALRWVLLALGAFVFGLPILLLLPAWALGVVLWRRVQHMECRPDLRAWVLFLVPLLAIVLCKAWGLHVMLEAATAAFFDPVPHKFVLLYSDEVLWNSLLALLVAVHLYGAYHLSPVIAHCCTERMIRAIRWCAGASFTLYVVHYPVLHLADAALPEDIPFKLAVFLALPLLVAAVFAELFERPLPKLRKALQRRGAARAAQRLRS